MTNQRPASVVRGSAPQWRPLQAGGEAFVALVLCGYLVPWAWTGVSDNTRWDWVHVLVVPFALSVTVTLVLHESRRGDTPQAEA